VKLQKPGKDKIIVATAVSVDLKVKLITNHRVQFYFNLGP